MPGFDRTGPRGMGPMTGGGFGLCTGFAPTPTSPYTYGSPSALSVPQTYPNYSLPAYGQQTPQATPMHQPYYGQYLYGWGMGRGLGLGWGRGYGRGLGLGWGPGFGMGWRRGFF